MAFATRKSVPGQDENPLAPLALALAGVTRQAALAAHGWVGRGCKEEGDGAAVTAMREAFAELPMDATVVIGEGEKDNAPMLYNGEPLGRGGPRLDVAVDPVEGTNYLAKGMPGAVSVLAVAPAGSMFSPGPAFYMDKFVVPAAARDAVDPEAPVAEKIRALGEALGRPARELRIFVLERPRHQNLIREIHAAGATVRLAPDGDVLGGVKAIAGDRVDALMGVGGTPEGVVLACAARALGAGMWGAIAPQSEIERARVREHGLREGRILTRDELIASDHVVVSVTGITGDDLLDGVRVAGGRVSTETLLINGCERSTHRIRTEHEQEAL